MAEDFMGVPGLTYEMYVEMTRAATTPTASASTATTTSTPAATSPAYTSANIGGTTVTAPRDFGLPAVIPPASTVSSTPTTPVTTADIGGTQVTAPASFGLPTPPVAPPPPPPPVYTTATIDGTTITAPQDFGLPPAPTTTQTTGSDYVQSEIDKANTGTTGTTGAPRTYTATDGKTFTDESSFISYQNLLTQQNLAEDVKRQERQSAFDILKQQFSQYGLGSMIEPLRALIQENVSPAEFTLRLRTDPKYNEAYKKRFAANEARVKAGLSALSEAEYIGLEDQYQNVMKRYGLPESYYKPNEIGVQSNFEKFISGDVSAAEVEDRIQAAQDRVINANPEVAQALRTYYPGITTGDILGYALDPTKDSVKEIQRKITAAEIGGAAAQAGLPIGLETAKGLAGYGVTKETAQKGYQTIADILPRGSQLASIYKESPYTQATAESEVFGIAGATEAARQRKKLTELEQASFAGQTGRAGGALGRERAGQF